MAERARCDTCDRDFPSPDALAMHNSAKHPISSEPKKKSKKLIYVVIIISILLIAGFMFFQNKSASENAINNNPEINNNPGNNNNPDNSEKIQKITLSFKNYNYYPNTITVKQGIPVEITLDSSIRGCYRSFNIKDLGVNQYSATPDQTITFTPDKKGNFEFACGMRMGTGTIVVE